MVIETLSHRSPNIYNSFPCLPQRHLVSQTQWPQSWPWTSAIWSIHSLRALYLPGLFFSKCTYQNPIHSLRYFANLIFSKNFMISCQKYSLPHLSIFFPLKALISYCLIIICKLNEKSPQSECRLQEVKGDIIYVFCHTARPHLLYLKDWTSSA